MSTRVSLLVALSTAFLAHAQAQVQDIYLGAGNDSTITVTTSHDHKVYPGIFTATGDKTVNGAGMHAKEMEAARFLAQSTLSFDREMIDDVVENGIEAWIDSQLVLPATLLSDSLFAIRDQSEAIWIANENNPDNYPSMPNHVHMDYAWWQVSVRAEDQLRQRVAEALSQIVVLSLNSSLGNRSIGVSTYYDILIEHALGNYEDILQEISRNPGMSIYLTFVNNAKADTVQMTFPDENYARELMQLFAIGLVELNPDGTPELDGMGNIIPTYDNDDIAEFAKIFTGLSYAARIDGNSPYWGMGMYNADLAQPLMMYEQHHDPGEKHLLNGYVVPAGQPGLDDVEEAVTHLFNHPNVGPFIGKQLIQRLVKSNPTPAYVAAVANAFNDNGQGVRGDMKAVVKTILMHPEARECNWMQHAEQGRLREPILRKTHFAGLFEPITPFPGKYWNYSTWFETDTDMHPLRSPSVFNFYAPTFSPNGEISENGLVAPEFGIYNSRTSIGYANQVYRWIENDRLLNLSWYEDGEIMPADLSALFEYSKDPDALLDYLDKHLTYGSLTPQTRGVIKEAIEPFDMSINDLLSRLLVASYLVLVSPDYAIMK